MRQCLSGLIVNNVWFLCMEQVPGLLISFYCMCTKVGEMFCDNYRV